MAVLLVNQRKEDGKLNVDRYSSVHYRTVNVACAARGAGVLAASEQA